MLGADLYKDELNAKICFHLKMSLRALFSGRPEQEEFFLRSLHALHTNITCVCRKAD